MHKRSPLIGLTARGERTAKRIEQTEAILLARLTLASSQQSVARAATVLRDVRGALEQQLPRLLRERGKAWVGDAVGHLAVRHQRFLEIAPGELTRDVFQMGPDELRDPQFPAQIR